MVAQRADVGVTDPMLPAGGCSHRLLGLRLAAPGLEPTLIVAVYLQAGGGLNATNRTLLATVAQWQEREQSPTLVGGDFNLREEQVSSKDFLVRSGTALIAPRGATYRTAKCKTTIDYFVLSQCLSNKVQSCQVLTAFL
jgi:exonuclease III